MASRLRLRFLGTGAAGGTPGAGRSLRRESSAALTDSATTMLIDVTGDFREQAGGLSRCDAILLTHGHSDAIGGLARLAERDYPAPIPVYAAPATVDVARGRFRNLDHLVFRCFQPGDRTRVAGWTVTCTEVPHAADPERFPTVAWRLTRTGFTLVYASDVAAPTAELRRFSRGADLLVIDGATYRRRIFTHLRIDEDLPEICRWPVGRILLTQIGRSAPPHEQLEEVVADLCERAAPAYDGLEVELA
jgi:phosphoribosyl 1,2-cyclic phosphodiesterase